jgi:hypothetical protein
MRLALYLILLSLTVWGSGCAQTELTAFRDPAFKDASYSDVVVMMRSGDLMYDKMTEDYFVQALSGRKVNARPSLDFFPPTRAVSQPEMFAKFKEEGAGALLRIQLESGWTNVSFYKGTSYAMPRAKYTTELIDLESGSVAWTASALSAGDEFSGPKEILLSLASKTAATLAEEGLIRPAEAKAGR